MPCAVSQQLLNHQFLGRRPPALASQQLQPVSLFSKEMWQRQGMTSGPDYLHNVPSFSAKLALAGDPQPLYVVSSLPSVASSLPSLPSFASSFPFLPPSSFSFSSSFWQSLNRCCYCCCHCFVFLPGSLFQALLLSSDDQRQAKTTSEMTH